MFGTLSVPSPLPSARNSTVFYYKLPSLFPNVRRVFNDPSINELAMHPICRAVCQVAGLFLCRVSEILSLTLGDIFQPDRVVCRGSKRGAAYIIYLPCLSQQVLESKVKDVHVPIFPVSYSQCYRSFVRAGIRLNREGYKNSMRCHAGRYAINKLYSEGSSLNVLSDLLRHKSKGSILYYLQ